jgi:glycosyltransferase involved in cell wall biosynthesis
MKLAILIPAFNSEDTIGETLTSLQNIKSGWEYVERLVVCDDASRDNTMSVVRSVEFTKCPLTVLKHSSNKGEAACYNTMIDVLAADTKWFLILHADDIALDSFLYRNLEIIKRCSQRVAAVSSNYFIFETLNDETLAYSPVQDKIIFRGSEKHEICHTAMVGCWWHISGSLINRDLWQRFGGRDPGFPQVGDWDLILRWQRAGYLVGHSLVPTTKCRINHGRSLSSRSYTRFQDLQERTKVVLNFSDIFSRNMRISMAMRVGLAAARRVCKLCAFGEAQLAVRGIGIGCACVYDLLRGQRVA